MICWLASFKTKCSFLKPFLNNNKALWFRDISLKAVFWKDTEFICEGTPNTSKTTLVSWPNFTCPSPKVISSPLLILMSRLFLICCSTICWNSSGVLYGVSEKCVLISCWKAVKEALMLSIHTLFSFSINIVVETSGLWAKLTIENNPMNNINKYLFILYIFN